jgi:iron(III) transport system ATP-binding protein
LPGRVLHARFQGDLAVLEIAAQGFERPLLTLVREWEVPERGEEVSIAVDPESVLVFPAEGPRENDANFISEASESDAIQTFRAR